MKKRIDLKDLSEDEIQKCKEDPVYWYNKYVRLHGRKELTKEEYERFKAMVEGSWKNPSKLRSHYKDPYPVHPDDCTPPNKDHKSNLT